MSTITAILEPQPDGTLHLPVPAGWTHGKIQVTATLERVESGRPPLPRATPEMIRRRMEALAELRKVDPFRELTDPAAWQREIRRDRPLPGRE